MRWRWSKSETHGYSAHWWRHFSCICPSPMWLIPGYAHVSRKKMKEYQMSMQAPREEEEEENGKELDKRPK